MYRKRATFLTITSLKALSKVRTPRVCSFDSIKASGLLRTLSIAAERSDFPIPSVSNGEGSVEYQRSPDGFYGDNQSHVGFHENPRIDFQHNPVGQNGNFSSGYYGEGNVNGFQGNPVEQNGGLQHNSSTGQNEIIRGNCGENSAELWQGSGGYNTESFRTSEKSSDGWYGEQRNSHNPHGSYNDAGSRIQQNLNGFSQQSSSGFPGNTWHHGGSVGQFQQGASDRYSGKTSGVRQELNNYYVGNTTPTQHGPGNYHRSKEGNYWQNTNVNDHYLGNTGVSPQSINNSSIGETAMTQQRLGNNFSGSTTAHQPGMDTHNAENGGVYPQGTYGYRGGTGGYSNGYVLNNTGEGAWNPRESYNADGGLSYQRSSNESQSAMVDSQVSNSFKADGESVEAAGNGPCSRTTEELDDLCKEGKLKEVVELLGLLESKHIPVDLPRYLMLLKACGEAKALEEAKYVHEHLLRSIPAPKVSTYNKILEMYGKCGSMDDALTVFQKMPQRNLTSWDTMITWYANNGLGEDAIDLFTEFKKAGLKPDGKMFTGVFHACGVLGDMIEGMLHFESMSKDHGIAPSMKHYASVVDMLATAGYLDEALEFIEKLPVEPSVDVWETLMNLSRVHGHAELGDRCAELVDLMDSSRLNEQSKAGLIPVKASDLAKVKEAKKLGPESLLSVRSKVHEYRAGDTSHPENDRIYALLRCLRGQMKEAGYVAETRFVLHDIDQESKEDALLAHSERLAVAYGLMNSPVRAQVRIIKNLRVCGDCHSALKIISKLVGREFIIRDAKRFHHFKDGLCSCRDYW